jgi:hypothetical protein
LLASKGKVALSRSTFVMPPVSLKVADKLYRTAIAEFSTGQNGNPQSSIPKEIIAPCAA